MRLHLIFVLFAVALASGCASAPNGPRGPDVRWLGTAQTRETGFDRRTWNGTPVSLVGRLIDALPDRIESAAEHRLARNILVTMADAPPGARDSNAFVSLRAAKLIAMGNFADAAALGRQAPDLPRDKEAAEREAEAELLAGEVEMACIDFRALGQRSSEPRVAQAVALCKARAGESDAVQPADGDAGVLVRIVGRPLPATLRDPSTAELAAISLDAKLPPARRLEPGFQAARASAIDGAVLAKIFQAVPSRDRFRTGRPAEGAEAAALFHAAEQAEPARKLALVEGAFLSPGGGVDQVSVAFASSLHALKPGSAPAPLSARVARLFFAVGDWAAARSWAEVAARSGQGGALWPYRAVLGQAKAGEFERWRKRGRTEATERIMAVVSAFGDASLMRAADRSDSDDVAAMDAAANSQRVGETVLRALALLGSEGPTRANPETLARVLADLDRVNQHEAARALAFEALTAAELGAPVDKLGTNAHS